MYANGSDSTIKTIQQNRHWFYPWIRVRLSARWLRVQPTTADWTSLAALPGVGWVEPARLRKVANDQDRVTTGVSIDSVTNADYLNLYGSNVLVEVNDSGIDPTHPDFGSSTTNCAIRPTRVIGGLSADSLVDYDGHGTHVAGIIAGNGTESGTINTGTNLPSGSVTNANFRGKAPLATLFSVGFLGANDTNLFVSDSDLQEIPAQTNALISNNSWVNGRRL